MSIESALAKNSYSDSLKSTGSLRSIEYEAFAKITRELSSPDENSADYYIKISKALYNNLRLWAILADDIANDNNALPNDLRSKLFYLAEFTRHHTAKVYSGDANPNILVEINTAVMRGLRASPPEGTNTECPAD